MTISVLSGYVRTVMKCEPSLSSGDTVTAENLGLQLEQVARADP
jgi:hypothetical protein